MKPWATWLASITLLAGASSATAQGPGALMACRSSKGTMPRQQLSQRLVNAGDETISDGDPDQNGDHTLRHREHVPVVVLGEAVPVVGDLGLAVDTDQYSPNVVQRGRAGGDRLLDLCLQRRVIEWRFAGGRER